MQLNSQLKLREKMPMSSPFPGMDPYIESSGVWAGFHHGLIDAIKQAVSVKMLPSYVARVGERSYMVLIISNDGVSVGHRECICPQHKRKGD
jgi:hypothetical protein